MRPTILSALVLIACASPIFAQPPSVLESPYPQSTPVVVQHTYPACGSGPQSSVCHDATRVPTKVSVETSSDRFRRQLLSAASKAAKSGNITRRQLLRLRVASFSPAFRSAAQDVCIAQMYYAGATSEQLPVNDDGTIKRVAINWDSLAAFLERIIPIIVELIVT